MPRKTYRPKNRFVVKSKLGESEFATLAWLYLQGMSAPQARAAYSAMDHPSAASPPSEKTISDIFRRLGTFIFYRLVEPALNYAKPELTQLHRKDPDAYYKKLYSIAVGLVQVSLDGIPYEDFRVMKESNPLLNGKDGMLFEIRKLSAKRQGIKHDPLADVGLSQMKLITSTRLARGRSEEEQVDLMLKTLLEWLLVEPLDEHGNPKQFIREGIQKFPYGNFGLPDPRYAAKKDAKD